MDLPVASSEALKQFEGKNIIQEIKIEWNTIHCKTGNSGFHLRPSGKIAPKLTELLSRKPHMITIKSKNGELSSNSSFGMMDFITTLQIWSNQDFTISCHPDQINEIVAILIDIEGTEKPSVPEMIRRILG